MVDQMLLDLLFVVCCVVLILCGLYVLLVMLVEWLLFKIFVDLVGWFCLFGFDDVSWVFCFVGQFVMELIEVLIQLCLQILNVEMCVCVVVCGLGVVCMVCFVGDMEVVVGWFVCVLFDFELIVLCVYVLMFVCKLVLCKVCVFLDVLEVEGVFVILVFVQLEIGVGCYNWCFFIWIVRIGGYVFVLD